MNKFAKANAKAIADAELLRQQIHAELIWRGHGTKYQIESVAVRILATDMNHVFCNAIGRRLSRQSVTERIRMILVVANIPELSTCICDCRRLWMWHGRLCRFKIPPRELPWFNPSPTTERGES